ncbi:Uncharacterized protein TCM_043976 [Theobroma cacao]|uniref:Uncharacterized protein n=1 Tax=Theobroma cacao TaxID=3641 RepID=A0A061FWL7_THECC|nr:Uncharacterized protein TCM_043976 [Theobroma cacao]
MIKRQPVTRSRCPRRFIPLVGFEVRPSLVKKEVNFSWNFLIKLYTLVLFDLRSTHSFVYLHFVLKLDRFCSHMEETLIVTTPLEEIFAVECVYKSCVLASCFAKVDYYRKLVKFKFLKESSFVIYRHCSLVSMGNVSKVASRPMPRQEGHRYLEMPRDVLLEEGSVDFVPSVGEYLDVFLEQLLELPPEREIEFCIDLVLNMQPIWILPYQMGLAKLKELQEKLEDLLNKGCTHPSVSP